MQISGQNCGVRPTFYATFPSHRTKRPARQSCKAIPDNELVEIVDHTKRVKWQRGLLTATTSTSTYALMLKEYYRYLKKLEVRHNIDQAPVKTKNGTQSTLLLKMAINRLRNSPKRTRKIARKATQIANAKRHVLIDPVTNEKCYSLEKNKKDRSEKRQIVSSRKETKNVFSAMQIEQIAKILSRKSTKMKKSQRKIALMFKVDRKKF